MQGTLKRSVPQDEVAWSVSATKQERREYRVVVPAQDVGRQVEFARPPLGELAPQEALRPLIVEEPWHPGEQSVGEFIAEPVDRMGHGHQAAGAIESGQVTEGDGLPSRVQTEQWPLGTQPTHITQGRVAGAACTADTGDVTTGLGE